MKSFKSVLHEAPQQKTRVLLFGRMNPPTKGHEENVNAAHAIAQKHNADLHVIASHSQDAKKNPLTPEQKATHLKRAFGHLSNTHVGTSSKEAPTILHQASAAHKAGVKHLVIAGGGDRASEYHKLLHTYNGKEGKHGYYNFHKISIENTGERKEGVSGTDMRKHAASGNFEKFRSNLPSKISKNEKHSQELYHHVRSGMGVHEDSRESYVSGDRLRLGENVIDSFTGIEGKVVYRGPTYVTMQIDEEVSFKRWIDDVDAFETVEDDYAGFKTFAAEAIDDSKPHEITPDDIKAIEASIDNLDWHDVEYLFKDDGDEDDEKDVHEGLNAQQRMKKKFDFLKSKSKREIAATIARHRVSTPQRMKKKAITHARTMIMQRLLKGRSKASLSATEKDRIEKIVRNSKSSVIRISNRLMSKLRELELKRMRKVQEEYPSAMADMGTYGETGNVTTKIDAETPNDEKVKATKKRLQGLKPDENDQSGKVQDQEPGTEGINPDKTIHRLKHFRKLEV